MAVGSIGGISVKISANIDGFKADLNKAAAQLDIMAKKVRSGANDFGRWGAAGVAAASAIATAMVKSQMQTIDALAKTADRLGLTTEALSGLQRAAELTGASTSTLDMALQRMTRRVAEAAQGTGEAKAAIAELGLSAQSLAKLSPDQQFRAIAEAMSQVTEQGDRVRLSMKLFDSEGVKLVNTLALGGEGLDKVAQEAAALGVAINRIDAAKVEAANDAMFTAGQAVDGVVTQLTIQLAPLITDIANRFTEASASAGGFANAIEESIGMAARTVGVFADGIRGISVIYKMLESGAWGFASVWTSVMLRLSQSVDNLVNSSLGAINDLISGMNSIVDTGIEPFERFQSGVTKLMTDAASRTSEAFAQSKDELHNLAMEQLPSQAIEEWLATVKAGANEASAAVASVIGGGEEGNEGGGLSKEQQDKLTALTESLMTEQQLKAQAYLDELALLEEFRQADLEKKAYYDDLERQLVEKHQQELIDIESKAAKAREKVAQAEKNAKMAAVSSMFTNMSALMNTESRKMFEIGKAAALANATVTGISAIQKSWDNAGGFPWGIPAAAAMAAAQLANIQQIKNTNFGSASSGQSYSGGQVATNTTSTQQSTQEVKNFSIAMTGDTFSASQVDGLISAIGERMGDGVTFGVTRG